MFRLVQPPVGPRRRRWSAASRSTMRPELRRPSPCGCSAANRRARSRQPLQAQAGRSTTGASCSAGVSARRACRREASSCFVSRACGSNTSATSSRRRCVVALQTALIAGLVVQRARRRRMELALRESERHFRMMADTAPVMIWRSGVDMRATSSTSRGSTSAAARSSRNRARAGSKASIRTTSTQCRHATAPRSTPREPFQKEYRLRRADGEYRWVLDVGVPRYDDAGRFAGYIGSALDITERKRWSSRSATARRRCGGHTNRTRISPAA